MADLIKSHKTAATSGGGNAAIKPVDTRQGGVLHVIEGTPTTTPVVSDGDSRVRRRVAQKRVGQGATVIAEGGAKTRRTVVLSSQPAGDVVTGTTTRTVSSLPSETAEATSNRAAEPAQTVPLTKRVMPRRKESDAVTPAGAGRKRVGARLTGCLLQRSLRNVVGASTAGSIP